MTLNEYQASGGCEGCQFYGNVYPEINIRVCMFPWFNADADEWEYSKNCDEMEN